MMVIGYPISKLSSEHEYTLPDIKDIYAAEWFVFIDCQNQASH